MADPKTHGKALREEIIRRISDGETLRSICRDTHLPARATVMIWLQERRFPEFNDQYEQARIASGHAHAEKITDIAEQVAAGTLRPDQARIMMDGMKWAAERLAAGAYNARQVIDHQSSDRSMSPGANLSDEELDAKIKRLAGK